MEWQWWQESLEALTWYKALLGTTGILGVILAYLVVKAFCDLLNRK